MREVTDSSSAPGDLLFSAPDEHFASPMQASTRPPAANLFWTGGWDSTFRLLQLLLIERRSVQPYYVIDRPKRRPAVPAERGAMDEIRRQVGARYPEASARLLPTVECAYADIAGRPEISNAFEQSLKFGFIGGQYEWLARFCAARDLRNMELSIHRDDKARELIAGLIDASRVALDRKFAGDARYELFKYFRFPLFDKTKEQMRAEARAAGFEELMNLTWFCHRPVRGEACGVCNPCIYTIEEGLGDRVPPAGHERYRVRIVPRLRQALARRPRIYLAARSIYRSLRR